MNFIREMNEEVQRALDEEEGTSSNATDMLRIPMSLQNTLKKGNSNQIVSG